MRLLFIGGVFIRSIRAYCINGEAFYKQFRGTYRNHGQSTFSSGNMSDKRTWETFYSSRPRGESFDWFFKFEDVKEWLDSLLTPGPLVPRILDVGCGTSEFGIKLLQHLNGKCRIDGIDFSQEAIRQMQDQVEQVKDVATATDGTTGLSYQVADARNLPFHDGTFSLALDKGTSDALLRGKDAETNFTKMLSEVLRVLRMDGNLVQFSDEPPEVRMLLIEKVGFSYFKENNTHIVVHSHELGRRFGVEHFMYVIHKKTTL